jgi:Tol biopolymer transport system component
MSWLRGRKHPHPYFMVYLAVRVARMRRAGLALFLLVAAGCGGGGAHGHVRNGAIAAVESFGGRDRIFSVEVNGSHLRQLTSGNRDEQPAWAPDGRSIAFTNCRNPNSCRIYTMRADGTHVRAVRGAFGYGPAWSPDGKKLLFSGRSSLMMVNLGGGGLTALNGVSAAHQPDWSPDGRRVAYANLPDVYVIDLQSGRRRGLHVGNSLKSGVAWSPDGREIAFVRQPRFVPTLMVVRPDGGGLRRIRIPGHFTPSLDAGDLDWSPDGRWLVLRGEYGTKLGIYVVPRSGGRPRLVLEDNYADPSWQAVR